MIVPFGTRYKLPRIQDVVLALVFIDGARGPGARTANARARHPIHALPVIPDINIRMGFDILRRLVINSPVYHLL
jgi:hypothetical protein